MDMWKLIKLEYRKNNIKKYLWGAVAAAVLLSIFMFALAFLGIANDPDTGVPAATPGNEVISASVELFTNMGSPCIYQCDAVHFYCQCL